MVRNIEGRSTDELVGLLVRAARRLERLSYTQPAPDFRNARLRMIDRTQETINELRDELVMRADGKDA